MDVRIDNQYRYGLVYNIDGQIVGFNLSPDIYVTLTDDDIEKALENYIVGEKEKLCSSIKLMTLLH